MIRRLTKDRCDKEPGDTAALQTLRRTGHDWLNVSVLLVLVCGSRVVSCQPELATASGTVAWSGTLMGEGVVRLTIVRSQVRRSNQSGLDLERNGFRARWRIRSYCEGKSYGKLLVIQ